jgi:hypothetical protein
VPVAGGPAALIATGAIVLGFGDNGDRLSYVVMNQDLYSYSLSTRTTTRLSLALPLNKKAVWGQVSPDAEWAVYAVGNYMSDQDTMVMELLYSVPIRGGNVRCLNGVLVDGSIVAFMFTPDSKRIVYQISTASGGAPAGLYLVEAKPMLIQGDGAMRFIYLPLTAYTS